MSECDKYLLSPFLFQNMRKSLLGWFCPFSMVRETSALSSQLIAPN